MKEDTCEKVACEVDCWTKFNMFGCVEQCLCPKDPVPKIENGKTAGFSPFLDFDYSGKDYEESLMISNRIDKEQVEMV